MVRLGIAAASALVLAALVGAAPARADEPTAVVRGDIPQEVREAIVISIGESERAPASRLEARRRAVRAAENAIAVLRNFGYYAYIVEPDVEENNRPVVSIDPGPLFLIREPRIVWAGEEPPAEVQEAAAAALGLDAGEPGRSPDIVGAQGRAVAALQKLGYADAKPDAPSVIVDHETEAVIPDFPITAGSIVLLDGIDLRTEGRTNPAWVRRLAPWEEGDLYDPEDVAELERRLLDVQVYESVTVSLATPEDEIDGLRPVFVSLQERPRRVMEFGAGYSTDEGAGVDARYTWYNRLGRADTLTALIRLAEIEQRLEGQLVLPHWRRAQRTLRLGAAVFQELTDAYDELGAEAQADITFRYNRTSYRTLGVSVDITQTDERVPVVRQRTLGSIAGLALIAWDRSNDPLNPIRGWRILASGEPTITTGDDSSLYLRASAQGSAYLPLDSEGNSVVAGRLRVASNIGGSLDAIPASRRYYAGGGGSVRGYTYQGVGPRLPDNTPRGGLSLFEGSVELRRKFTRRWGGVVFVDVGGVSLSESPDFSNVSAGAGFGVRYDLGFGPIRADIAVPLEKRRGDPSYQIYLSIGQAF